MSKVQERYLGSCFLSSFFLRGLASLNLARVSRKKDRGKRSVDQEKEEGGGVNCL